MNYGICNLSIVPLRLEASDTSEMVSQVIYGDVFKVLGALKFKMLRFSSLGTVRVTWSWCRLTLTLTDGARSGAEQTRRDGP